MPQKVTNNFNIYVYVNSSFEPCHTAFGSAMPRPDPQVNLESFFTAAAARLDQISQKQKRRSLAHQVSVRCVRDSATFFHASDYAFGACCHCDVVMSERL